MDFVPKANLELYNIFSFFIYLFLEFSLSNFLQIGCASKAEDLKSRWVGHEHIKDIPLL